MYVSILINPRQYLRLRLFASNLKGFTILIVQNQKPFKIVLHEDDGSIMTILNTFKLGYKDHGYNEFTFIVKIKLSPKC